MAAVEQRGRVLRRRRGSPVAADLAAGRRENRDCYALNATDDGVWACPYTDFPLVRFVPGEPVRWWRNEITGPQAIAIDDIKALLAGG